MSTLMDPTGVPAGYEAWEDEQHPRVGFFTDTSICIGCKACEVACKEWNLIPQDGQEWLGRSYDHTGELNAEMPEFWVAKVVDALNEQGKAVRGSRVLLLGVAYKKNIDDIRESPALDVIRLLHRRGAQISYHDPHVPTLNEDGITMNSVPLTAETLRGADCVMIITDHTAVDYQLVKRHARATVDTRHVLQREPKGDRGGA